MYKLVVIALFVASASAGIVTPVERCPAQGLPLQLRVTDCEGAPPCTIEANKDILIEGDFIPSAASDMAKFRLIAETSLGPITVTDGEIGPLVGGLTYTASQSIRISNALAGQSIVAELSVYDVASDRKEICVRAPMNIVE